MSYLSVHRDIYVVRRLRSRSSPAELVSACQFYTVSVCILQCGAPPECAECVGAMQRKQMKHAWCCFVDCISPSWSANVGGDVLSVGVVLCPVLLQYVQSATGVKKLLLWSEARRLTVSPISAEMLESKFSSFEDVQNAECLILKFIFCAGNQHNIFFSRASEKSCLAHCSHHSYFTRFSLSNEVHQDCEGCTKRNPADLGTLFVLDLSGGGMGC